MNVAVLGIRSEGREIASACARAGHTVRLHAEDPTKAMDLIDDIERRLADAVESGRLTPETKADAMDELEATTNLTGAVSGTDVVIETTISESEPLQQRFADVESAVDRETLITTSTPTVSVTSAAAGLRQPDRALGLHFFDGPDSAVVELLIAGQTAEAPADRAEEFIESLGATTVRVRDTPGVVSNRLRLAIEAEAMRAVDDEVASVEGIDTIVCEQYQTPEGPLEQADRAGLDSRLEALERLTTALGPRYDPPPILEQLVEEGKTGTDAGEGFYKWELSEPVGPAITGPELPERDDQPDDPATR